MLLIEETSKVYIENSMARDKDNCNIDKTDRDSNCMGKDNHSTCEIRNLGQSNNN